MKKLLFTMLIAASMFGLSSCNKGRIVPEDPTRILMKYVTGYWLDDATSNRGFHIEENQFFPGSYFRSGKMIYFKPGPMFTVVDNDGECITYEMRDVDDYHCIVTIRKGSNGKLEINQNIVSNNKVFDYVCTRVEEDVQIDSPGGFNPHPGF